MATRQGAVASRSRCGRQQPIASVPNGRVVRGMFQARQVWQPHPAKRVPGAVEFQCGANAAETVGENLPIEAVDDADAILQVYEPFLDKGCGLLPTDSAIPFCRAYAKTATLDVRSSDCTGFQDAQQKDVGDEDDAVKDNRVAGAMNRLR